MNRGNNAGYDGGAAVPRRRGDEPAERDRIAAEERRSPQARG